MDDSSFATTTVAIDPRQTGYTQVMYALHAASIGIGVLSAKFVVTAFVFGAPSLVAVIMNYARRNAVRGTWLESHFQWQRYSFWIALALFVGATLLWPLNLIGLPLQKPAYFAIGIWAIYRVARGWRALHNHRTLPLS